MDRKSIIASLRKSPNIDVLIVGAGINGIGTFRDLALNGVNTLIIDRADFCSGASAGSSHMLHGGIRYLENGEFRLVREALRERNRLLRNAPHYAKPLPTTIPIFKWLSGLWNAPFKFLNLLDKPAERGAVVIKIGLMLYDAYVRGDSPMPGHHFTGRDDSLRQFPGLNSDILCTATYFDGALISMERLCVELLLDGEADGDHAKALNYTRIEKAQGDTVTLLDGVSGKPFDVKPKVVINAAGPWIDVANLSMGRQTKLIGGTKGSHLVLDHPELRKLIGEHEFFFENTDGRIVLIYPFIDRVLVGTTDIHIDDPDQARCTPDEEAYILKLIHKVFPTIQVDSVQVVYRFSGVRPLPASGAKTAGQISRDHSIEIIEPGRESTFPILSLVGGKWTTYRAFSEQAADAAMSRVGKSRQRETRSLGIGGGRDYPVSGSEQAAWIEVTRQGTGLHANRLEQLFRRYGTRARLIAQEIASRRGKDKPLKADPTYTEREIAFLVEHEKVVHLEDILKRRTLISIMGKTTTPLLKELGEIVGQSLGWSAADTEGEIQRTVDMLAEQHGVQL
jgi:glycerol-3-phosphate dehydrogenase